MIDDPKTAVNGLESELDTEASRQNRGDPVTNMAAGRNKFLMCAAGVFVSYFYYGIIQESISMAEVKICLDEEGFKSHATKRVGIDQERKRFRKFVICALGIFVCHCILGVLQELLTKGKYGSGEHEEKFTYTMALIFVQCIINAICARGAMALFSRDNDTTPTKMFALCSVTYVGAMLASNQSLQYITYPTQVLGKSVKPIPVMILGIVFAGKRYPPAKFLFILMICLGVAMFMYKDKKPTAAEASHTFGFGEILLLVSLTLDGLTGATQDRMRSESKTGAYHMMLNLNLWSILWLAIGLLVSGEGIAFLGFMQRFPSVLLKMFTFGLASAVGQVFIFITVTSFGPLPCSIVTTTRKFFTILASVIIFGNPMHSRQWLATVLVFVGLGLDSVYGKEKKDAKTDR